MASRDWWYFATLLLSESRGPHSHLAFAFSPMNGPVFQALACWGLLTKTGLRPVNPGRASARGFGSSCDPRVSQTRARVSPRPVMAGLDPAIHAFRLSDPRASHARPGISLK